MFLCHAATDVHMVHLWCTYGALMVLLFWFVCKFLWSKFDLCPGMGNDSLAICMSKKTPQKWSAEEQCEWNISCTMSYLLFLQLWTLTLLVQAAFQTQTQKIPVGNLKKSGSWESFAEFSVCLIWALLENIWKRKVLLVTASAWIFEGVGILLEYIFDALQRHGPVPAPLLGSLCAGWFARWLWWLHGKVGKVATWVAYYCRGGSKTGHCNWICKLHDRNLAKQQGNNFDDVIFLLSQLRKKVLICWIRI